MKKFFKDQRGFFIVDTVSLVFILLAMVSVLYAMGEIYKKEKINESYVTAIYLLDGEMDYLESQFTLNNIPRDSIEKHKIGQIEYETHFTIGEDRLKKGLYNVEGKVKWEIYKKEFSFSNKRQIYKR